MLLWTTRTTSDSDLTHDAQKHSYIINVNLEFVYVSEVVHMIELWIADDSIWECVCIYVQWRSLSHCSSQLR